MGWVDDLRKATKERDATDAARIHRELPTLPRPKRGSSVAIMIPKRVMGEGGPTSGWYAPPKGTHGPGSQGGKESPDDYYARTISKSGTEIAIIVKGGKEIDRVVGDESSVRFPRHQFAMFRNAKLIHNHPRGSSFSLGDVTFAVQRNMAEIQVVTQVDDRFFKRHRMIRPEGGWPSDRTMEYAARVESKWVAMELMGEIRGGEITREQANGLHWSRLWENLDDSLGFDYHEEFGRYVDS